MNKQRIIQEAIVLCGYTHDTKLHNIYPLDIEEVVLKVIDLTERDVLWEQPSQTIGVNDREVNFRSHWETDEPNDLESGIEHFRD